MAFFDFPYEQLITYKPALTAQPDFDQFWQKTLAESRSHPIEATFESVDVGLETIDAYDVSFNGYAGQSIKGWLLLPHHRTGKLPCVIEFIGYGGGRGFPTDWLVWASSGFAHFVMDTRGQGSVWLKGDTADIQPDGSSPHQPGFMTLGVLSPKTYYYRRVFTDAVRAVEAALQHPEIDPERLAATGGSQGGGITIAAAGLEPRIKVAMPDVPFLCHYRRATEICDTYPYREISAFCQTHRDKVDQVFHTLTYFDGMNLCARIKAQCLFSVGLMDNVCPPSTVYAAYNHLLGPKDIRVYTYNYHDGGGNYQTLEKTRFLRNLWK
jgi:cephalosporin-C deacetylase